MTSQPLKLCDLDEIDEGNSGGFFAERNGRMESYIVVRKDGDVFVYLNSCPHIGSPLDFAPGRFLNPNKTMILCSTHGALFRIEDGHCVSGPCAEQELTVVPVHIRDGTIYLAT
jgi:nitrite reductase/ring-hydroxylating ferredoxin subunit